MTLSGPWFSSTPVDRDECARKGRAPTICVPRETSLKNKPIIAVLAKKAFGFDHAALA
jgi:hypothetical protein